MKHVIEAQKIKKAHYIFFNKTKTKLLVSNIKPRSLLTVYHNFNGCRARDWTHFLHHLL